MKWKKLSSKKLFEHPRISIYEDEVELPNGHRTTYIHFGKMKDSAMCLVQRGDGKFLIQKEYSYPPDEVLYQLPGGIIDKGETPLEGATRELAEEAGLTGTFTSLGWYYIHNRRTSQKTHLFLVTNPTPVEGEKDDEELFEDYWFTAKEIAELIRTNEFRNYTLLAGWAIYSNR